MFSPVNWEIYNKHSEQNISGIICGKIQYALSVNKMNIFKNIKLIYLLTLAELNLVCSVLLCFLMWGLLWLQERV